MQRIPSIYIAPSALGGRGIFTSRDIVEGSILEICPVIVLPPEDIPLIHKTRLHDYYFLWGEKEDHCAIILGFGSFYNHSYRPNAEYFPDYEHLTMDFKAIKPIQAGEEITVNYGGDPNAEEKLWFEVK